MKTIFIVAGEASGDVYGASLSRELKQMSPDIKLAGFGGQRMKGAGVELLFDLADLAVIGFLEVLKHLFIMRRLLKVTEQYFKEHRPTVVVLIDYPGFNFKVGKLAHKLNIPVIYYIAPQIWAWWPGRIKEIKEFVRKVLVIFSFEEQIYQKENIPVLWVGHPMVERLPQEFPELNSKKRLIGLLPGSRKQEVAHLLPAMVAVAEKLASSHNDLEFVLLRSDTIEKEYIEQFLKNTKTSIKVFEDEQYQVRQKLTLALVASGTATLENAYLGIPMIIMYKINPLSYFLGKKLVKIPYIGLANIVSGQKVVPEFIQQEIEPEIIANQIEEYLAHPGQLAAMRKKLLQVREKLGQPGASRRTAIEIIAVSGVSDGK